MLVWHTWRQRETPLQGVRLLHVWKLKDRGWSYVSLFWQDRRDVVICVCEKVCVQKNVVVFCCCCCFFMSIYSPEATVRGLKIWSVVSVFNELWVVPFTVWEIMSLSCFHLSVQAGGLTMIKCFCKAMFLDLLMNKSALYCCRRGHHPSSHTLNLGFLAALICHQTAVHFSTTTTLAAWYCARQKLAQVAILVEKDYGWKHAAPKWTPVWQQLKWWKKS